MSPIDLGPDIRFFQHQPLRHDPQNPMIRVLELFPGTGEKGDLLRCTLLHVSLSDNPEYDAVSYCWGRSPERRFILCDEALLDVTENLSALLFRLRLPHESRYLWADSLCINQSDPEERSQQVRLMGRIYQSAKTVHVWLGYAAYGSKHLEDFVPLLLIAVERMKAEHDDRSIWDLTARDRKRYLLPHPLDVRFVSLLKVASRPWFGRVWIIQEICFATKALMYCGEWSMPWNSLVDAVFYASQLCVDSVWPEDIFDLGVLHWTKRDIASGAQHSLLELLFRHHGAQATDPRDKVFALCSLACDSDVVQIDYRATPETIYMDAATKLMVRDQSLDILSAARLHDHDLLKGLPSWVPDWSVIGMEALPLLSCEALHDIPWQASRSTKTCPLFQNNGLMLGISGQLIDEIVACGPHMQQPDLSGLSTFQRVCKLFSSGVEDDAVFHEWKKVAGLRSGRPYITGETRFDAYWQTLCAGAVSQDTFEAARDALTRWHHWEAYHEWADRLWLDTLGLDYRKWLYKFLSFVSRCIIALRRGFRIADQSFELGLLQQIHGRKFVRTRKGYLGLTSRLVCVGDKVGLFKGSKVPLIIRRKDTHWQLLGESYIHGMMYGECFDEGACELMWFC
jgi:hypothetical protein